MGILKWEFRKFNGSRGWLILPAVFILQMLLVYFAIPDVAGFVEISCNKEEYFSYLEKYSGKLTDDKLQSLYEEEKLIEESTNRLSQLSSSYIKNEISRYEYNKQCLNLSDTANKNKAFQFLKTQANYCQEASDDRCLMYENSWDAAMQTTVLDIPFLIGAIVVSLMVFSGEYKSGMSLLLSTSEEGRSKTLFSKITLTILIITLLEFMCSLCPIISSYIHFNSLKYYSFPIQSIRSFSLCIYSLTVIQAYIFIWALKIFSALLIGLFTCFVCICVRNGISSFFIGSSITIIPYIMLNGKKLMYYIPHIGLDLGRIYLSGIYSMETESYTSVSGSQLIAMLSWCIMLAVLCIGMSSILWRKDFTMNLKRRY